ncbi:UNVERIFIED_CONTAM: hypothetical protein Slati_2135100 [Sesamum latifolium]|uniref:Uncharacterized protein n=1 Tax=Sesamum latifolium TaxID=2727402 RepID=A0AAW2WQ42_9LAMI
MANFWWHSMGTRRIHWTAWTDLCQLKDGGGLGFRQLESFNLALLAKQGWRLLTRPHSQVGNIFRAKYYPNSTFIDTSTGTWPSLTWCSIVATKDLLIRGGKWKVRTGYQIRIWRKWLSGAPNFHPISPPCILCTEATVLELIDAST